MKQATTATRHAASAPKVICILHNASIAQSILVLTNAVIPVLYEVVRGVRSHVLRADLSCEIAKELHVAQIVTLPVLEIFVFLNFRKRLIWPRTM